jgi:3-deoxy-D-manno-octulosonate 8-phosphate phosphatase (KDO 8-P phosphatase)
MTLPRAGGLGSFAMSPEVMSRARRIRLLTCDVDGVLTDGRIYVDDDGREFKAFSALDGVGLNLLARGNVMVAWITGSAAPAVAHRARQLHVQYVILDTSDKLRAWDALRADLGVEPDECAHIGDDLPDIPVMAACGLAVTVPHAPAAVRAHAHMVTARDGGQGAVRELAEMLLAAQGRLEALVGGAVVGTRA